MFYFWFVKVIRKWRKSKDETEISVDSGLFFCSVEFSRITIEVRSKSGFILKLSKGSGCAYFIF